MKTAKFESTVEPGDKIVVYKDHGRTFPQRDLRYFTFIGYSPCTACGDPCPGYIDLTSDRGDMQGCFRSSNNIRLRIIKKIKETQFLPDELFEV